MADKRFGGFWRRLLAYGVDKIILHILSSILFLIGILAMGLGGISLQRVALSGEIPRGMEVFLIVYWVTTVIVGLIYFTWFHGTIGQTPGKMLLCLRVIQVSGEKMTPGLAFLRWVGYIVSSLPFWLGFLWIAFDGRKQGWHDKIAATLVVRTGYESERDIDIRQGDPSDPIEKCLDKPEDIL